MYAKIEALVYGIILMVIVVVGASVYFGLTSPVGQQGLVGMFQQLGNAIIGAVSSLFTPITATFNGLGHAITNFFSHLW